MNEEFNKFKKKILKEHLAKCIAMGISFSAIFTALLFILLKRIPLNLHFILYILLFVILSFGLSWLLYKNKMPNDESIAKRLDKTYALNEKIQTMVVCGNEDNEILKMQKEDAENSLKNADPKNLSLKLSFINYLALLIAVIFVSTSFVVPAAKANPVGGLSSSNTSETTSGDESGSGEGTTSGDGEGEEGEGLGEKLEDIRDAVQNSDAEEKVKEDIEDVLDELEEKLENAESKEEQEEAIQEAIDKVDQIIDEANSKEEIGEALMQEQNTNLVELGAALILGDVEGIESSLNNLEQEFMNLSGDDLINDLLDVASQIEDALLNSGVAEDDELYMALNNLAESLKAIANELSDKSINETSAKEEIHNAIEKAKEEILQDIILQNNNEELGEQVKDALENLLDSEPSEEGEEPDDEGDEGEDGEEGEEPGEEPGDEDGENPSDGEEENENNEGGPSDGDTIYAGNDQVFSDKGHSEYGDVLDDYYDRIVDENSKGNTPDDIGSILDDYFASLYH